MDLQMPEVDGLEATRRIRALAGRGGLVPVVVGLTASALPEDFEACRAAGMNDVLVKPITWAALEAMLRRLTPPTAAVSAKGAAIEPAT
jgi:CheY-like chemotaxis protein